MDLEAMAEMAEEYLGTADAGPLFEALYSGRCAGCRARWQPGDFIASIGEEGYLCADCAREA